LTTLRYFEDEYRAHIEDKKCPAGACRALITFTIDAAQCTGCGAICELPSSLVTIAAGLPCRR
jgi:hypothetical protein